MEAEKRFVFDERKTQSSRHWEVRITRIEPEKLAAVITDLKRTNGEFLQILIGRYIFLEKYPPGTSTIDTRSKTLSYTWNISPAMMSEIGLWFYQVNPEVNTAFVPEYDPRTEYGYPGSDTQEDWFHREG